MIGQHIYTRVRYAYGSSSVNEGTFSAALTEGIFGPQSNPRELLRNAIEPKCSVYDPALVSALKSTGRSVLCIYHPLPRTTVAGRTFYVEDALTGRGVVPYTHNFIFTGADNDRFLANPAGAFSPATFLPYANFVVATKASRDERFTFSRENGGFFREDDRPPGIGIFAEYGFDADSFAGFYSALISSFEKGGKTVAVLLPDTLQENGQDPAEELIYAVMRLLPLHFLRKFGAVSHDTLSSEARSSLEGIHLLFAYRQSYEDVRRMGAVAVEPGRRRYPPANRTQFAGYVWQNRDNGQAVDSFHRFLQCGSDGQGGLLGKWVDADHAATLNTTENCFLLWRDIIPNVHALSREHAEQGISLIAETFAGAMKNFPLVEEYTMACLKQLAQPMVAAVCSENTEKAVCRIILREKTLPRFTEYATKFLLFRIQANKAADEAITLIQKVALDNASFPGEEDIIRQIRALHTSSASRKLFGPSLFKLVKELALASLSGARNPVLRTSLDVISDLTNDALSNKEWEKVHIVLPFFRKRLTGESLPGEEEERIFRALFGCVFSPNDACNKDARVILDEAVLRIFKRSSASMERFAAVYLDYLKNDAGPKPERYLHYLYLIAVHYAHTKKNSDSLLLTYCEVTRRRAPLSEQLFAEQLKSFDWIWRNNDVWSHAAVLTVFAQIELLNSREFNLKASTQRLDRALSWAEHVYFQKQDAKNAVLLLVMNYLRLENAEYLSLLRRHKLDCLCYILTKDQKIRDTLEPMLAQDKVGRKALIDAVEYLKENAESAQASPFSVDASRESQLMELYRGRFVKDFEKQFAPATALLALKQIASWAMIEEEFKFAGRYKEGIVGVLMDWLSSIDDEEYISCSREVLVKASELLPLLPAKTELIRLLLDIDKSREDVTGLFGTACRWKDNEQALLCAKRLQYWSQNGGKPPSTEWAVYIAAAEAYASVPARFEFVLRLYEMKKLSHRTDEALSVLLRSIELVSTYLSSMGGQSLIRQCKDEILSMCRQKDNIKPDFSPFYSEELLARVRFNRHFGAPQTKGFHNFQDEIYNALKEAHAPKDLLELWRPLNRLAWEQENRNSGTGSLLFLLCVTLAEILGVVFILLSGEFFILVESLGWPVTIGLCFITSIVMLLTLFIVMLDTKGDEI